jgi:2'-5' RNA ligase
MGPIPASTSIESMRALLAPIARETPPLTIHFLPPIKFMQSNVVVLPIDPHGPIRALHDRIKTSGIPFEKPRFAFTPHCTLSFYPELSRDKVTQLLSLRFDEPVTVDRIAAFRSVSPMRTENVLELSLSGA